MEVLAERKSGDDLYLGFSDNYIEVGFRAGEDCRGQMVKVRLKELTEDHCFGDIL
jgi:tRNA A37 methylthiotransferase MiaB